MLKEFDPLPQQGSTACGFHCLQHLFIFFFYYKLLVSPIRRPLLLKKEAELNLVNCKKKIKICQESIEQTMSLIYSPGVSGWKPFEGRGVERDIFLFVSQNSLQILFPPPQCSLCREIKWGGEKVHDLSSFYERRSFDTGEVRPSRILEVPSE